MNEAVEPDPGSVWERRVALTEANGRRVNEAIERGHRSREEAPFVCECGRVGCSSVLVVALDAYEEVRAHFDRFLVVPGHELGPIEEVVERLGDVVVVRKKGAGVKIAAQTDPRDGADR